MQPKIQKAIQKQQPSKQQLAQQERKENVTMVQMTEKPSVEAFNANEIQQMTILNENNNLYASIRKQEVETGQQILNIKAVIHKIRSGEVRMDELFAPFGMGNQRKLGERHKQEYLDTYMRQLQIEENKLKSINGQRLHRGEELGEQRLKVFRMFTDILINQHKFSYKELFEHCEDYMKARESPSELHMISTKDALKDVIEKAKQL